MIPELNWEDRTIILVLIQAPIVHAMATEESRVHNLIYSSEAFTRQARCQVEVLKRHL